MKKRRHQVIALCRRDLVTLKTLEKISHPIEKKRPKSELLINGWWTMMDDGVDKFFRRPSIRLSKVIEFINQGSFCLKSSRRHHFHTCPNHFSHCLNCSLSWICRSAKMRPLFILVSIESYQLEWLVRDAWQQVGDGKVVWFDFSVRDNRQIISNSIETCRLFSSSHRVCLRFVQLTWPTITFSTPTDRRSSSWSTSPSSTMSRDEVRRTTSSTTMRLLAAQHQNNCTTY